MYTAHIFLWSGPYWFQKAPVVTSFLLILRYTLPLSLFFQALILCSIIPQNMTVLEMHISTATVLFLVLSPNSLFIPHIFHVLWLPSPALGSLLSVVWCVQVCWHSPTGMVSWTRHNTIDVVWPMPAWWAHRHIFIHATQISLIFFGCLNSVD